MVEFGRIRAVGGGGPGGGNGGRTGARKTAPNAPQTRPGGCFGRSGGVAAGGGNPPNSAKIRGENRLNYAKNKLEKTGGKW